MKKDGKGFSVALISALALGAVGIGVVLAFLAGYFLGHFTGHSKTTTVSALASAPEASAPETSTTETTETSSTETGSEEGPAGKEQGQGKPGKEQGQGKEQGKGNEKGETKKGGAGGEAAGASLAAGKTVFESNCGTCHTLAEAGTSGTVGPNLDELKPEKALVETQVTNGGGVMPAFGGTLSPGEIEEVAEYVSTVAGTGA